MTIIVEDGSQVANAESYTSVAEADAYHTARGNETTWTDLDVEVKEQALRKATDYMVQAYSLRWKGYRMGEIQALDWPRGYVYKRETITSNGFVPNNVVPDQVKHACAELAFRALSGPLLPDLSQGVLMERIGPIETTYDRTTQQSPRYIAINAILRDLLRPMSNVVYGLARV
jgi:hypothetical protein